MKHNKTISTLLMGALLVTMSACGAQQAPAAQVSESEGSATVEEVPTETGNCKNKYLPVIAGTTWNYTVTGPTTDTFTRSITSASKNGFTDQDVFGSGVTRKGDWNCGEDGSITSLAVGDSASVQTEDVSLELQTDAFLGRSLPGEINAGDSWQHSATLEGKLTGDESIPTSTLVNSQCTAAGVESVTVPAGTFDAIRVDCQVKMDTTVSFPEFPVNTSMSLSGTSWYAEGVGMVKSTTTGGGMDSTTELTSYSIP